MRLCEKFDLFLGRHHANLGTRIDRAELDPRLRIVSIRFAVVQTHAAIHAGQLQRAVLRQGDIDLRLPAVDGAAEFHVLGHDGELPIAIDIADCRIFGGSRFNITGPTAALVPLLQGVVMRFGAGALPLVGFMAGLLLLLMSVFKIGRLARFVPELVVVGFTAGIGLSSAFGQVNTLLGIQGDASLHHFSARLLDTLSNLTSLGPTTALIGVASIAVLFLWQRWNKRIPGALIVIVAVTVIASFGSIDVATVASRYGEMPKGLPLPTLGFIDLDLALDLLPAAIAVAVLAGVESLLSATVADGMAGKGPKHAPDRELLGQGIANLVSPIMSGIPATAAIARTGAGIRNGATSQITGVVHSLTVLSATLVLGGLAGRIPLTVLSAILIVTAWNIAGVPAIVRLWRSAAREDILVLLTTILVTLFFDLSYAIALGVLISLVLLLRQFSRVRVVGELIPNAQGQIQQVSNSLSTAMMARPDIAFFTAWGVISFHCTDSLSNSLTHEPRPLVLRLKDVSHIDASGLLTLREVVRERQAKGQRIVLTAPQPEVKAALARFGIAELLGPQNLFDHTIDAIAAIPGTAVAPVTTSR